MASIAADRNLLFGLLALQNGLINQAQLVAAFQAWTLDKARALADHLVALGHLNGAQKVVVEAMADLHVAKHGDLERSLAAVSAGRSTHESLARLGDPDIEGTLAQVRTRSTEQDGEANADRTASYSVGTATSDGLRFRILRPLARGGLGAVFVALDQELHREVALKQILDSHADDPTSRQRFLLEAEVTGGLEHPGIVPVYGLGTYGDGRPYYAMRFIRGDSLKEAIQRFHRDETLKKDPGRRSLELRKLLRRFLDVCNAIDYAHSRGVLHRDIKPANIIVGKHGETLVVDWGLAKAQGKGTEPSEESLLRPSSASVSSDTLPGSALGTPAYMSPEQARGDLDSLGPRSDVYSLGGTLYCLLAGKPPQEGDDIGEILRKVQRGELTPPSQLDPSIDKALEAVCLKAMALTPEDRYVSCRALAEDIERWMADEPVRAWHEHWTRSLVRWLTRHRVGVTALGAAMLVALVGTLTVLGVQTQANAALKAANIDLAVANTKVTRANTDLAAANQRERARFALAQAAIQTFHTGVSEDVLLKQEEFTELRKRLLREAREFYRKLEELLQGQADRDSRLGLGRAYYQVGELTKQLDSTEEAQSVLRRALTLLETLSREDPADPEPRFVLAQTLQSLATAMSSVGRRKEALSAVARSRDLFWSLFESKPGDHRLRAAWARCESIYAACLDTQQRNGEALDVIRRALTILETPVPVDPSAEGFEPELQGIYETEAQILGHAGHGDEAIASSRRARDVGEALFRAKPRDPTIGHGLVMTLGNLGIRLQNRHPEEALATLNRAREVIKAAAGANPTLILFPADSAWIDASTAQSLAALGRYDEALQALQRAQAARETLIKANPAVTRNREQLLNVLKQTADIHRRAGRLPEVVAAFERVSQVAAGLADDHPQNRDYQGYLAWAYSDLGDLHGAMGKPREAAACFDKAIAVRRKLIAADPSSRWYRTDLALTIYKRGIAMQKCGRPADAARDFRQFTAVYQELTKPTPQEFYDWACVHSLLAGAATEAGSGLTSDDARAAAEQAMTTLHRAFDAGWNNPVYMRNDRDLDPIRSRPDFQLLMMKMMDRDFPAEPFSKDKSADR
jgi:eukaryotic-like serine/threonine-protein kinase